jgi:hypothetical protein
MSAPVPIAAIKCQLAAIVRVAIDNDSLKLPVRAAFRDGLQLLERDGDRLRIVGAESFRLGGGFPRHGRQP